MANNNVNQNQKDESIEKLKEIASLSYSQSGYVPSGAEWRLTEDQIKDIVLAQSKTFVDDIRYVTVDLNKKTGNITVFVWIPRNSRHVTNNDLRSSNSAINRTMTRYSDELREYMNKFCKKGEQRIIPANDDMYVGLKVNIEKFLIIEFDKNGSQYAEKYGTKNQKKTEMRFTIFAAQDRDNNFGKLQYLLINKRITDRFVQKQLSPKRSFNA